METGTKMCGHRGNVIGVAINGKQRTVRLQLPGNGVRPPAGVTT